MRRRHLRFAACVALLLAVGPAAHSWELYAPPGGALGAAAPTDNVVVVRPSPRQAYSVPAGSLAWGENDLRRFLPSGYVSDGTVDYGTQLAAALSAAASGSKVLEVPAGKWTFGTGLVVPTGVTLKGAGPGATELHYTGSGDAVTVWQTGVDTFRVLFSGLKITGTSQGATGLRIGKPSAGDLVAFVSVRDVWVEGFTKTNAVGIWLDNPSSVSFDNVHVYLSDIGWKISADGANTGVYSFNNTSSNAAYSGRVGLVIEALSISTDSFSFNGCHWSGSEASVQIHSGSAMVFNGNHFEKNASGAMVVVDGYCQAEFISCHFGGGGNATSVVSLPSSTQYRYLSFRNTGTVNFGSGAVFAAVDAASTHTEVLVDRFTTYGNAVSVSSGDTAEPRQVVQAAVLDESGMLLGGNPRRQRMAWASSVPASGTWRAGDIVWNTSIPTITEGAYTPRGWLCVYPGTPGTWREMDVAPGGLTSRRPTPHQGGLYYDNEIGPAGRLLSYNGSAWYVWNGGKQASVADGGTFNHGLGVTPSWCVVSGTVSGEFVSLTALGASTGTLAIKKHDNTAGTAQTIHFYCGSE